VIFSAFSLKVYAAGGRNLFISFLAFTRKARRGLARVQQKPNRLARVRPPIPISVNRGVSTFPFLPAWGGVFAALFPAPHQTQNAGLKFEGALFL